MERFANTACRAATHCCRDFEEKFMGETTRGRSSSPVWHHAPSSFLSNLNIKECLPALNVPNFIVLGAAHLHNRIMESRAPVLLKIGAVALLAGITIATTTWFAVIGSLTSLALAILSAPCLLLPRSSFARVIPGVFLAISLSSLIAIKHMFILVRDMFVTKGALDPSDAMNRDSYSLHDRFVVSAAMYLRDYESKEIVRTAEARWAQEGVPSHIAQQRREDAEYGLRVVSDDARRQGANQLVLRMQEHTNTAGAGYAAKTLTRGRSESGRRGDAPTAARSLPSSSYSPSRTGGAVATWYTVGNGSSTTPR